MISKEEIKKLAELARLEVSDDELVSLGQDVSNILTFVETIQKAEVGAKAKSPEHRNVMRADENPHEGGAHTEKLLGAAPVREGNRIAVKRVLSRHKASGNRQ